MTLIISAAIYIAVAIVAIGTAGVEVLKSSTTESAAPLEIISRGFHYPVHRLVAVGAMSAMLGVQLNLVFGLSRVLLAMGRRGDMPPATTNLNVSIVAVGCAIGLLAALGSIKTTWSFSAFASASMGTARPYSRQSRLAATSWSKFTTSDVQPV